MNPLPAFRRAVLSEPGLPEGVTWTIIAVAAPTALRWVLDRGTGDLPFITYLPPILLVSLFMGWRYGAVTALASGIVANRFVRHEPLLFYVSGRDAVMVGLFALSCAILIYMGQLVRRLVRDQEDAVQREVLLNQELNHRVKNMLAVTRSMATLSARHSDPADFLKAFDGRIAALATATDLIGLGERPCTIHETVEKTVAPFRTDRNIAIEGPECALPRASCVPFVLALHELCTNATKHGAFSVPDGRITLSWRKDEMRNDLLHFRWLEQGGPQVRGRTRNGVGSRILRAQDGLRDVRLNFHAAGLECEIEIDGIESRSD